MKHCFPEKRHVYCNETHTLEQAKEFVFMAKLVGLKIDKDTRRGLVDKRFPYFCWDHDDSMITQHAGDGDFEHDAFIVSFDEFKKFLGPIPSTRIGMEKLFATIKDLKK